MRVVPAADAGEESRLLRVRSGRRVALSGWGSGERVLEDASVTVGEMVEHEIEVRDASGNVAERLVARSGKRGSGGRGAILGRRWRAARSRCDLWERAVPFDMANEIPIASVRVKGVAAVALAVVVGIGAFLYNGHRRATLHAQGREQVEEYLETELVARRFRESGGNVSVGELTRQKDFEIVEFSTPFVPSGKTRVRVVVKTPDEEIEYYFRFERVLGEWTLRGETRGGLFH